MRIDVSRIKFENEICILSLDPDIGHDQYNQIECTLTDLLEEKKYKVILDMSSTRHVTSGFLGLLVSIREDFIAQKGDIKIVARHESLFKLFEVTMLNRVLPIFHTLSEAQEDFY